MVKRGRPARFGVGDLVTYDTVRTGCVVDHRPGADRPYRVVETAPDGSRPRGPALWMRAFDLAPTGEIARLPVKIYEANRGEGRAGECQCRIHYDDVRLTEGSPGFIRRLRGIADRAGWSLVPKNPSWIVLEPSAREGSSTAESLVKGIRRAASLELVEVKVSRHGGNAVGVRGDFSEAVAEGVLQPRPDIEPEMAVDGDDDAVRRIEALGWAVRARLPGEWWIVPYRGKRSAEDVATRLGLVVLRPAAEGVWIEAPNAADLAARERGRWEL